MGPSRSKIKKTRKSIMQSPKGESRNYTYAAVLGICIACLPFLVAASQSQYEDGLVGASDPKVEVDLDGDLEAAESQNVGVPQRIKPQSAPVAVPTSPVPVAVPPPASSPTSIVPRPVGFTIPKTDLASAPSYAPRYAVPPVNPWRERFPFEVQQFRRRAQDNDDAPLSEDDYQPQESKGKKHSPSVLKRVRNSIRNTGKAIVGAPSYIIKRYRGTWKKYFGGSGGKKKKGGWKAWSSSTSDKNDGGWGGWEEVEPTGGYYDEPSHYSSDKGWKSSKGYSKGYGWDSHERRDRDRESTGYRDYRERDNTRDYDTPSSRPSRYRPERGDRPRQNSSYREETHYDDYDGRRTTAYYGPSSRKSSDKRPSSGSRGGTRYDDDY